MVIGFISFAATNTHPSNALNTSDNSLSNSLNSARNSSNLPTAADKSFRLDYYNTSYVDPLTKKLYAAGNNGQGQMGLGNTTNQHSFTPLYKSGDKTQEFINPRDWDLGRWNSTIIDSNGKLWTTGLQNTGSLGNGIISSDLTDNQLTFEMVTLGLPDDYNAVSAQTGGYSASNNTVVVLDNGDIYGAGNGNNLGLPTDGGVNQDGTDGGNNYPIFTKLNDYMPEELDPSKIIDFKTGAGITLYLLDDGSLWSCNASGYKLAGEDVTSFDATYAPSYYTTTNGDVYYSTGSIFNKILSKVDDSLPTYEGTIKEIYSSPYSDSGWAYLTTDGDVYYSATVDGTEFMKIAQDVLYFDMAGQSNQTFGAITKDGEFRLWGSDTGGMLGNGSAGSNLIDPENPLDAFNSEAAVPSNPTTDGTNVTPPALDADGNLDKDENGNTKPIIPNLSTPAPARIKFS